MRLGLLSLLSLTGFFLSSCASEKIYTVKNITDEGNGRSSYFLADENGQTMILRQKKSQTLIPGSRIKFVEDI